jgi:hypothetical protein
VIVLSGAMANFIPPVITPERKASQADSAGFFTGSYRWAAATRVPLMRSLRSWRVETGTQPSLLISRASESDPLRR